jgi:alanine racemase
LFSNKAHALVLGKRVPVIGRVCMDYIMLDLTGTPEAQPGDEVVLLGRQGDAEVSADELAEIIGTNCYEVACMTRDRLPVRYIY